MGPGGKGSNQAIAVARLGGTPTFLAKIGDDIFGREALALYEREEINTKHILVDAASHTGAGIIFVDHAAQNSIGVAPGANFNLSPMDIDAKADLFVEGGILLVQLETALPTVQHAVEYATKRGMTVVLNPAPAQKLPRELVEMVDIVTPNETEAGALTGQEVRTVEDAARAGQALREMGAGTALITMGGNGAMLVSDEGAHHFEPYRVSAVDTTGAGDAFNGGLVFALARGDSLTEAVAFAGKVGAYSVQSIGVVPGLPRLEDITTWSTAEIR